MSNKSVIHIIATGGTIDYQFSPKEYKPVPRPETVIPDFISDYIKPNFEIKSSTVSMIDSLYMTDEIRLDLIKEIKGSSAEKILITHGTDGMIETAQFIAKEKFDKTIVMVGAMIPLIGFTPSDGGFNLGFAVANLRNLDRGTYICMNGEVFLPDDVCKNRDQSWFENKVSV